MIPLTWFSDIASFFAYYHDLIQSEGIGAALEDYAYDLFLKLEEWFFSFLDTSKEFFIDIGQKALYVFQFDFTKNFLVTVVGFIFGFFVFKFILSKIFDLIGRWLDPM